MKYSAIVCILFLVACGTNRNDVMTKLLNEQKFLKDSANNINERIGGYANKSVYDSADAQTKQLRVVHARLIEIQFSMDSLSKMK